MKGLEMGYELFDEELSVKTTPRYFRGLLLSRL
jgi:hypothetical protein